MIGNIKSHEVLSFHLWASCKPNLLIRLRPVTMAFVRYFAKLSQTKYDFYVMFHSKQIQNFCIKMTQQEK